MTRLAALLLLALESYALDITLRLNILMFSFSTGFLPSFRDIRGPIAPNFWPFWAGFSPFDAGRLSKMLYLGMKFVLTICLRCPMWGLSLLARLAGRLLLSWALQRMS